MRYHLPQIPLVTGILEHIAEECPGICMDAEELNVVIRCADEIKAMVEEKSE